MDVVEILYSESDLLPILYLLPSLNPESPPNAFVRYPI